MNTTEEFNDGLQSGALHLSNKIESGKYRVADALNTTTDAVLSGMAKVEDKAMATASVLADGAEYLRRSSGSQMLKDCRWLVSKYPFQSMAAVAVAALVIGRSVASSRR